MVRRSCGCLRQRSAEIFHRLSDRRVACVPGLLFFQEHAANNGLVVFHTLVNSSSVTSSFLAIFAACESSGSDSARR